MLSGKDAGPHTETAESRNIGLQASHCMPLMRLCKLSSRLSKAKQAELALFGASTEGQLGSRQVQQRLGLLCPCLGCPIVGAAGVQAVQHQRELVVLPADKQCFGIHLACSAAGWWLGGDMPYFVDSVVVLLCCSYASCCIVAWCSPVTAAGSVQGAVAKLHCTS